MDKLKELSKKNPFFNPFSQSTTLQAASTSDGECLSGSVCGLVTASRMKLVAFSLGHIACFVQYPAINMSTFSLYMGDWPVVDI